ncbi:MAG: GNAT family N-acetyltransferase [Actinomycetota bacterium]
MDGWDRAEDAARVAGVQLRPLTTIEDADRILDVMIATWGNHQLLPREMIVALGHSGNTPYGAFDGDQMIGYVLGWAGVEPDDGLHMHSHMLATLPDRRHRGVGLALKMAQRAQCLEQGITLVRWTFDPLLSRNAHFNLTKLGAVADRFLPNFYGEMTDTLNAGERSDRLMVRWDLEREPVQPFEPTGAIGEEVLGREGDDPSMPSPSQVHGSRKEPALIRIPREYHDLRERDRSLARSWREATSDAFTACLEAGLVATGFTDDSTYILTRER